MEQKPKFKPNQKLKLMDQVREVLRYYHYAYRTEATSCHWILRYIHFYGEKTHPNQLDSTHIERFWSHWATEGQVAAATQRQALNAIVFLYRDVLDMPFSRHDRTGTFPKNATVAGQPRCRCNPAPKPSRTASSLNSLVNRCLFLFSLIEHLTFG